jgi:uncharacterized protein YciI
MLFIVQFEDIYAERPERLSERALHMPDHLAFLEANADRVVASGALRDTPDGMPNGGVWILNMETKVEAESFYKEDPFWKAGLRKSVRVSHWAKAHWSNAFTECIQAMNDEQNGIKAR